MKTAIQELIKDLEIEIKKLNSNHRDDYMQQGGIEKAIELCEHYMTKEREQIVNAFDVGLDLGDTRNYIGTKYYECKFILNLD